MILSGAHRFGLLLAVARGRAVLSVAAVALACGAGGAAAQSGQSSAATAHVYWSIGGAGTIREANLNGTGAKTIARGQSIPSGVAVSSSHLYWANQTPARSPRPI